MENRIFCGNKKLIYPAACWALVVTAGVMLFGSSVFAAEKNVSATEVAGLRCEFMKTPLGIDDANPALSWTISDGRRGVVQTAYRVLVASSEELLAKEQGDLWDSGVVESDQSHLVIYEGKPLVSRQRCYWKVLVKTSAADGAPNSGVWSQPDWWEMGLLQPEDWQGSWIQSAACTPVENELTKFWTRLALVPQELNAAPFTKNATAAEAARKEGERLLGSILPVPVFRSTFNVPGMIKSARLYIAGLGFQESFINGVAVSDRMHDPSVNFYQGRGGYVTHDITALVKQGENSIAAIVGGGWWNESVIWGSPGDVMGQPSLRAQVEVELTDGTRIIVPTGASWTTAVGPMLKSHYYVGEVYDARRAPDWKSGKNSDIDWVSATEVKAPVPALEAQRCEPERVIRRVKPVAVTQPRPGIWVFDLGELIMGTVELNVKAPAGTEVLMRTAEWTWNPAKQGPKFTSTLLHYDQGDNSERTEGMIASRPRGGTYFRWGFKPEGMERIAKVHLGVPTLLYVTRGAEAGEIWRPSFTTHPFRYIEVQGLKEAPTLNLLTGLTISNDEEDIGRFSSSNPRFNAIWEASMNSTRYTTHGMMWDNAVERLQSQVYTAWSAPFASYVLWYPNLWRKMMEDGRLCGSQTPGKLSFGTAIYGSRGKGGPAKFPVTQGTTVELPMQYYDRYGDVRELGKQYPYMKAWCEAFFPNKDGKIINEASMGAWNDHFYVETCADSEWTPKWDTKTMMSMMLYEYVRDTADTARILKKTADAASLDQLAQAIAKEINASWYNAKQKTYGAAEMKGKEVDASTGWHGLMAMAIAKGIAPEADVPALLDNCIADMKTHYNGHHAAGHITHQLLYDVYSGHGMVETCYDMMNATNFPSFAWMLQSGNRTIPEGPTWVDQLPAKSSAYQNECQEPARWFTQTLCGISPDRAEPGFKHILLRPHFPSRLQSAELVTTTPYGKTESRWSQNDGIVTWNVCVPPNSYATAWIPAGTEQQIKEKGQPLTTSSGCKVEGIFAEGVRCRLGSGVYQFSFPAPTNEPSRL